MKRLPVLLGFLALLLLFIAYENYKVTKSVNWARYYWADAIAQAQQNNLTVDEFYSEYNHAAALESDDTNPSPALVQTITLDGLLCPEYSFRIYYAPGTGDNANLTLLTGSNHGLLCFL